MKSLLIIVLLAMSVQGQSLLAQPNSSQAIALDAVRMTAGPFAVLQPNGICALCPTRVMLFAGGLTDSAAIAIEAEDSNHHIYPLVIEHVDNVPARPELFSITVKLRDDMQALTNVSLRLISGGIASSDVSLALQPSETLLVFDGNSLTAGVGASSSAKNYPNQVIRILGALPSSGLSFFNFGVPSQTTTMMSDDAGSQIDPLSPGAGRRGIVVAWEITNDLYFGATAEDAYQHFLNYCQARRAAGWKVIALTILPRTAGQAPLDFEENRMVINERIRSHYIEFADGLADVAQDSRLNNPENTQYFTDRVHLTDEGYAIVARAVADSIKALQ